MSSLEFDWPRMTLGRGTTKKVVQQPDPFLRSQKGGWAKSARPVILPRLFHAHYTWQGVAIQINLSSVVMWYVVSAINSTTCRIVQKVLGQGKKSNFAPFSDFHRMCRFECPVNVLVHLSNL